MTSIFMDNLEQRHQFAGDNQESKNWEYGFYVAVSCGALYFIAILSCMARRYYSNQITQDSEDLERRFNNNYQRSTSQFSTRLGTASSMPNSQMRTTSGSQLGGDSIVQEASI